MDAGGLAGFGRRLWAQIGEDDVAGLAAELAYRFLFAVFPFVLFVAALASFAGPVLGIEDPAGRIVGALGDNLPAAVAEVIAPQLRAVLDRAQPGLLSVGALGALWAATGGVGALMKAMNRACDVAESRGFVARTALAIGLTLLASLGLLVSFVTIVGGSLVTRRLAEELGVGAPAFAVLTLLRWPLVLVLLAVAVAVLFRVGPNVRAAWRLCLGGGLGFAVGWLAATGLFALYVANFSNYANTYGALGGVIVLLLWFYLTAFLLVVAAEGVALVAADRQPEALARDREAAEARGGERPAGRGTARRAAGAIAAAVRVAAARVRDREGEHARGSRTATPGTVAAATGDEGAAPLRARSAGAWYRPPRRSRLETLAAGGIVAAGVATGALAGLLARRTVARD